MKGLVWSPSRVRTMNECARRYVHQHIIGRGGYPGGPRQKDPDVALAWRLGNRRPSSDLMMRAASEGIKDWLESKNSGEGWTSGGAQVVLTARIRNKIREQGDEIDEGELKTMVEQGMERISGLQRAPTLALLESERVSEWMPLDRLKPMRFNDSRVYAAPDMIAKVGNRWHLIRLTTQMWRRIPSEVQQLELGVMLQWALNEPGLPNDPAEFVVQRIGWLAHRWLAWQQRGSAVWLDASRLTLLHDLRELGYARRSAGRFSNLDLVEASGKRRDCKTCGYEKICPSAAKPRANGRRQELSNAASLGTRKVTEIEA
jgi:hypothetical protein